MLSASLFLTVAARTSRLDGSDAALASQIAKADQALKNWESKGMVGASVGASVNGKIIYSRAIGQIDRAGSKKPDTKTTFRIGSNTKQFTSAIILQLVREKKLNLTDRVDKYLMVPKAWGAATIAQLLNHTSGIPSYTDHLEMAQMSQRVTPSQILKSVQRHPMDFQPGEKHKYNNTGYVMLGMIIEKLDRKGFYESVKTRILDPLGMTDTNEESKSKNPSIGFESKGKQPNKIDMSWPYSAGALVSTANDMLKFGNSILGTTLLSESEKALAFAETKTTKAGIEPYGFGWALLANNGKLTRVEHGGNIPGYNSYLSVNLKSKVVVTALLNCENVEASAIVNELAEIFDPSRAEAVKGITDTNPQLTQKHQQIIVKGATKGEVDASLFAESFLKQVPAQAVGMGLQQLAKAGAPSDLTLLEEKQSSAGLRRKYFLKFGAQAVILAVAEDKAGLITGMLISPG